MKSIRNQLAEEIRLAAASLLTEEGHLWPEKLEVRVEQPARMEHGDYATNIAMQLASILRRAPLKIAESLQKRLEDHNLIAQVDVVAPGFLNFFLDWKEWALFAEQEAAAVVEREEKIVIEHTSINPNKAAHIGHLRNSCIGDTLARLFRRVGYQVEVHNYIDDLGNQVADTVAGMLHFPMEGEYTRFGDFCWDLYAQVNRQEGWLEQHRERILKALEKGENNIAWTGALVAEKIVREHLEDMADFGIGYNLLVWESDIVREGFWLAAFDQLQHSPLFVKEESGTYAGCYVLKQPGAEEEGEQNPDKVLVRSNGILTYTAKDIAYHLWKFGLLEKDFQYRSFAEGLWRSDKKGEKRPFGSADQVLNVIDHRQEYPQRMVQLALHTLGYEKEANNLHHVSYGVVSLSPETAERLGVDTSDGKSAYPMSGRQGIGVKVSDLLKRMEETVEELRPRKEGISSREIAAAAIRYYLLRFNLMTEIVFDLDRAADLHGNSGVYLMYQHARASKILQSGGKGQPIETPAVFPSQLLPAERALLRHLADWPDILEQAREELNIPLLTGYAYQLASLFSSFYNAAPVLKEAEPVRLFRLWLVERTQKVLADGLELIGLPAPQEM